MRLQDPGEKEVWGALQPTWPLDWSWEGDSLPGNGGPLEQAQLASPTPGDSLQVDSPATDPQSDLLPRRGWGQQLCTPKSPPPPLQAPRPVAE